MHIDLNLTLVLVGIILGLLFIIFRDAWNQARARQRTVVKPPVAAETPPVEKS